MAPSKKPLFDPPPPTTLDHFFAKPDALNNRSASSQCSHVQKRAKAIPVSSRVKPKTKHNPPPSAEIIVLGSDDDVPVTRTKRKAVELSESSSDVEVVEAVTQRADDASSSGKKAKVEPGSEIDHFCPQDLFSLAQDNSLQFSEFGRPKLLIPAEEDVPPVAQGENVQTGSSVLPEHLSGSETLRADPHAPSSSLLEIPGNDSLFHPNSSAHGNSVIEIDDEWGTGDDELARTNNFEVDEITDDDEIEEVLMLEDGPPATSGDNRCPFCGDTLTSFSSHVSSLPQSASCGLIDSVSGSGYAIAH